MQKVKSFLNRFPRHLIVAASAWISRIITALISIISVRTLLLYLGEERYAVYAIVYSLSVWCFICDLGIGPALQNFISECRARNESYKHYLKAALQIICAASLFFLLILFCFSNNIQTRLLSNYLHIDAVKNVNIIFIIGSVFLLTLYTNMVYRIYYALQKGYIANILLASSMVVSMCLIVLFNRYSPVKGSIITALLIFTIPQLLASSIPFIKIFKDSADNFFKLDRSVMKELMTRTLKFSFPAAIGVFILHIDYIIMSQTVNPTGITTYNILNRIFMFFMLLYSALLSAASPVFSELNIKSQYTVIKRMIFKYISFGICIIFAGTAVIYIFSNYIMAVLAPNTDIQPALIIFILFGLYYVVRFFSDTFSTFLSSVNALKIFWIYMPIQAAISIAAQYFLSLKYGINGILLGLTIAFLLTSCIALPYKAFKLLNRLTERTI